MNLLVLRVRGAKKNHYWNWFVSLREISWERVAADPSVEKCGHASRYAESCYRLSSKWMTSETWKPSSIRQMWPPMMT